MGDLGSAFFSGFFGGDPGSNVINAIGDPHDIFGSRPQVAPFVPIDLSAETGKAISANLENLPEITKLLDNIIPGFSDLLKAGTQNALDLTQGKLPEADVAALRRDTAFRSLSGGYGGTPMADASFLRNYGLSLLQGNQIGLNFAQQWTNLAETAFSPFTISTGQQAGTTAANNAGIQAQKQFEFNVAAAPDPALAGIFAEDQYIGHTFLNFGLGAIGGAISGGGGATGAAPTGGGNYIYDPSRGTYTPVPVNTGGSPNFNVAPTWGGGG